MLTELKEKINIDNYQQYKLEKFRLKNKENRLMEKNKLFNLNELGKNKDLANYGFNERPLNKETFELKPAFCNHHGCNDLALINGECFSHSYLEGSLDDQEI